MGARPSARAGFEESRRQSDRMKPTMGRWHNAAFPRGTRTLTISDSARRASEGTLLRLAVQAHSRILELHRENGPETPE